MYAGTAILALAKELSSASSELEVTTYFVHPMA